jgi:hypothetical protein
VGRQDVVEAGGAQAGEHLTAYDDIASTQQRTHKRQRRVNCFFGHSVSPQEG